MQVLSQLGCVRRWTKDGHLLISMRHHIRPYSRAQSSHIKPEKYSSLEAFIGFVNCRN